MRKNQDLYAIYSQYERFLTGYAVAVLRLLPEGFPSVEDRLLKVLRGGGFPLTPEAFAEHLQRSPEGDATREVLVGALTEMQHQLLDLLDTLSGDIGREITYRPLSFLSEHGEGADPAFALTTLARGGHLRAREDLLERFSHWPAGLRWAVLALLEHEGDWHWMGLFLASLKDHEPEVIRVAVTAIGKSGVAGASTRLLGLLKNHGEGVAVSAALALARLRDPEAIDPLMDLAGRTRSQKVRATVVSALGEYSDPKLIAFLARHLEYREARVRANALTALRKVFQSLGRSEESVVEKMKLLLDDSDHRVRADAIHSLWELGHMESVEHIESMLQDEKAETRASAAWLCGRLKLFQLRETLIGLMRDPEWNVRKTSAVALLVFGDTGRQALRTLSESGSPEQQISAVFALSLTHDPKSVERLLRLAQTGEELSQGTTDLLLRLSR